MAGKQQDSRKDVEKYFFSIKKGVSNYWKDLADCLGLWNEVDNIESKITNRDDESRCRDLLAVWKTRKGDAATIEVLMEALVRARLQSVVDGLREEFAELRESQPSPSIRREVGDTAATDGNPHLFSHASQAPEVEKYFDEVIKKVSHKWDELARNLGFSENEIKVIENLKPDQDRRCREMLHRWRNREGSKATLQVLKQALIDIDESLTAFSL